MASFDAPANSSANSELYIEHSMIQTINTISEKIVLTIYLIALVLSIMQTFWKNKYIDRFLASMNQAYSGGKFRSSQVCFRQQIMTCYQYDQRFSHIPHPKRSIVFIFSTHIQVLIIIVLRTSFTKRTELIKDCSAFHSPSTVLQCEDKRDPCQFNDTGIAPKCTYYDYDPNNFITMVTSLITWHYALRYLIVKLIRLVRWILFRNNDQPRKICRCCRATPRLLRCLMYFQYISLWLYVTSIILCGFVWKISLFRLSFTLFESAWIPILIAGDRLCTLSMAFGPELIQNWLDATLDGETLLDLELRGLLYINVEPLVYLSDKKGEFSVLDND